MSVLHPEIVEVVPDASFTARTAELSEENSFWPALSINNSAHATRRLARIPATPSISAWVPSQKIKCSPLAGPRSWHTYLALLASDPHCHASPESLK